MVKCEEFHDRFVADPHVKDLELARHMRECSACQNFADEEIRFNRQLAEAAAIDVPVGFTDRLKQIAVNEYTDNDRLDDQQFNQQVVETNETERQGNTSSKHSTWFMRNGIMPYAMAAGLAFVAGFGGVLAYHMINLQQAEDFQTAGLQAMVVSHITNEHDHLVAHDDVEADKVKTLLAQFGAELRGELGKVNYADTCEINNRQGMHMVLEGKQGPVTVLYIADKELQRPVNIDDPQFSGLIIPLEHGSLAIVGEKGERVEEMVETFQDNVIWRM